jgi:hypothetical protein
MSARHEHGIVEQSHVDVLGMAGRLVLVLRHALHLDDGRDGVEDPGQLRDFGDGRLHEEVGYFRVRPDAERQDVGSDVDEELAPLLGIVVDRHGVVVGDEELAVSGVFRLEALKLAEAAGPVSDA